MTPGGIVSGTFISTTGAGEASTVVFTLVGFGSSVPYITGSGSVAQIQTSVTSAANGMWSTNLIGNFQITPSGTYYQVQIYPAGAYIPISAGTLTIGAPSVYTNPSLSITPYTSTPCANEFAYFLANWAGSPSFITINNGVGDNATSITVQWYGSDFTTPVGSPVVLPMVNGQTAYITPPATAKGFNITAVTGTLSSGVTNIYYPTAVTLTS